MAGWQSPALLGCAYPRRGREKDLLGPRGLRGPVSSGPATEHTSATCRERSASTIHRVKYSPQVPALPADPSRVAITRRPPSVAVCPSRYPTPLIRARSDRRQRNPRPCEALNPLRARAVSGHNRNAKGAPREHPAPQPPSPEADRSVCANKFRRPAPRDPARPPPRLRRSARRPRDRIRGCRRVGCVAKPLSARPPHHRSSRAT